MADFRQNQMDRSIGRAGVEYDAGLRSYMLGVYNYMSLGIAGTAILTLYISSNPALMNLVSGLGIFMFFALIGASMFGPTFIMRTKSTGLAHAAFWGYAALWSIAITPMVGSYLRVAPELIGQAFGITAILFGSMSILGYTTKKNLSGMAQFAAMAMIGVLIAMVVNYFLASTMFSLIISCAYILLISAITAYETQAIKNMYSANDASGITNRKSIFGAFLLYGSFISMFIHILSILGIMGGDE